MSHFVISRKDGSCRPETVEAASLMEACERLSEGQRFPLDVQPVAAPAAPRVNSEFGGALVTDAAAKARIEAQQSALNAAGVKVDASRQFFATGTRMADVGYATQRERAAEHAAKLPLKMAADRLADLVTAERRHDVELTSGQFGTGLHANGKITFDGLAIGEQAIRGLATRLESPMLGYLLGLRDRIARNVEAAKEAEAGGKPAGDLREQARIDRAEIAAVMAFECKRNPDVSLKLRTRRGPGDVFAVVSPGYVPADAPEAVADLVAGMPADARGSFQYDPHSTAWELRASVWTPTPVDEQAVGEAFEGYATFRGRDNGTGKFRGGGGVTLIRCLNASTYNADGAEVSRVHRGKVMADIEKMVRGSLAAIDALCKAWGANRSQAVEIPSGMKINDAIPGFWRWALTDRKSELVGVLPGRSERHVEGLTSAFFGERRESTRLVRSDFAQGWTKYIQEQPAPVRREAEAAIGDWLMSGRAIGCEVK